MENPTNSTPPKQEKSSTEKESKRKVLPVNEAIYQANLSVIPPEQRKFFDEIEPVTSAVENDVVVSGLKNPIMTILLGFTTRRVYDEIMQNDFKTDVIFIYEPNPGRLKATMQREWVGDILNAGHVELVIGDEGGLAARFYKLMAVADMDKGSRPSKSQAPEVICDPFAYNMDKDRDFIKKTVDSVTEASKQLFTAMGCSSDTFCRWENALRNVENSKKGLQTKPYMKAFKGKPCIVLGGGPSIEDFIRVYKEKKWEDKIVVIACDAILRRLLKEDIKPHFVIRCERKLTTIFEGVTREKTKDILYLGYPWTPPEFFELFEDFSVVARHNGICNNMGFDVGSLNGGVSAANACFELAHKMECSPILMSGIDLCFIDGDSHVKGTEIEFDVEKSKSKWVEIEANDGSKQMTIPVWARCRSEYQSTIFKYQLKNIYNTSTKGAKILMTEYKALDSFNFERTFNIVEQIKGLHKRVPDNNWDLKSENIIKFLERADKDFKKLFAFVDDSITIAKREEVKAINQLFIHKYEPTHFMNNVRAMRKQFTTIYAEPLRQIEKLKGKYFADKTFCELVVDTLQVDFYHSENKLSSLPNMFKKDGYEMSKAAIDHNFIIFKLAESIIAQMLDLFKNGAKPMKHEPIKEVFLPDREPVVMNTSIEQMYAKYRKMTDKIGKTHGYF